MYFLITFKNMKLNKICNMLFYESALHIAIENKNLEMINLLLSYNTFDVNANYI